MFENSLSDIDSVRRWSGRPRGLIVAAICLFLTVVSVLSINQYQYGTGDQSITIPFLKQSVHPELFPDDYLLSQRPYYYTYLWDGLGVLSRVFDSHTPIMFFVVYFISLYASFLAIGLIAKLLFRKWEVVFLSLFFFLFSRGSLAGVATLDRELATRTVALPILLFAIYFYFKRQYYWSFVLQGIGFLIHPMTAAYVSVIILFASVADLKRIGFGKLLSCYAILVILASPILIWKLLHSPQSLGLISADLGWVELLKLRSAHHIFPFSWGLDTILPAVLLSAVFFISWRHKPEWEHHRIVIAVTGTILLLCVIGVLFSEMVPVAVVLNLQPLRSFQFLIFIAMIYFANFYVAEMQAPGNLHRKIAAALMSLGILYKAQGWQHAYGLFLIASAVWIFLGSRRHPELWFRRAFPIGLVVMVLLLVVRFQTRLSRFSIYDAQESNWLDVQHWAKSNTGVDDLFIVPPTTEGFRVESERTVYGDWKDGTLMNFNPAFGLEWYRRMERLGYREGTSLEQGFKALTESEFRSIAEEIMNQESQKHKVFLVTALSNQALEFPKVYRNDRYITYDIR